VRCAVRFTTRNARLRDGFGGDVERLFVSAAYANQGPSQKRVRPAPMGRAFRVVKRTAHLTVEVTERPQKIAAIGVGETKTPARRARVKKAAAAE
jgi:large subunit ribosomal protein L22